MMADLFSSTDGYYRVRLTTEAAKRLLNLATQGWPRETGGVLVGYYTPTRDTAVVDHIDPPPPDSRAGRHSFERGVQGLRDLLLRMWNQVDRRYYLGEWHVHPGGLPVPSSQDVGQMQQIADGPYKCPEPILILLGGSPKDGWTLGSWVFRRGADRLALHEVSSKSGCSSRRLKHEEA